MSAKTILNYNFKGGVGKTTLTALEAYLLSYDSKRKNEGNKVLLIDFDPQSNLTEMIEKTFNKQFNPTISLGSSLDTGDLGDSICHATKNLDIVPTDWSLTQWAARTERYGKPQRYTMLKNAIGPIKNNYDYIFIDVPPTLAAYSINAIFAADAISIVLQTQEASYSSALKTIVQLNDFRKQYGIEFNFLGIIMYLMIEAKVDRMVKSKSIQKFSDMLFDNRIHRQERVKGFQLNGISDETFWDKRAIGMYKQVTNEMIKRLGDD